MSSHTAILCSILVLIVVEHGNQLPTGNNDTFPAFANQRQNITHELPTPFKFLNIKILRENEKSGKNITLSEAHNIVNTKYVVKSRKPNLMELALQTAAMEGLQEMSNLYEKIEPEIVNKGKILDTNHPASLLSKFSAPEDGTENIAKAAFASIVATRAFRQSYRQTSELGRQADSQRISFRRTALEGLCPPREAPICLAAAKRYRTHDGTCNNSRRPRWGAAQMPFNRFLPPEYGDGVDSIRTALDGGALPSARFVSLLVHGSRDGDAPVTLLLAQWGQLIDHDITSTAQPRSINGSVPRCCGPNDFHPSCFPIKVPIDDPWLSPLKVRCLEFLRSAPAQRRDCVLSWREQTNQATSFIDASPVYSSNARSSDVARVFRNGLLVFGRGNPVDDVCMRGAIGHQCIRAGDGRSGEQPGLLALHHVWVGEHNRIALELSTLNPHWSDEKVYQETRRIVGALFQHITFREFLPIVLGREVSKLFDLELLNSGYYTGYDQRVNPSVSNSFSAAAFRFGHSLVQGSYMRCDRSHRFLDNNVTLHEEFQRGDIGTPGSLHRLLRGLSAQRALKRDEFITAELTNHLFQTEGFPFGLDLAAINIQRGRDHGVPPYTRWREPCGLSPIKDWDDLENVVGPESRKRMRNAYTSVHDIDLFVGGISERPVVGGLVGPTFACIIAQQFSNLRKGDRFWYENPGFESSFTPAQLDSIRRVSLAQIMCRAVGGGTFQPHIFIPHEFTGNERVPCNTGTLAPIDLLPWTEQDPFLPPDRIDITTSRPTIEPTTDASTISPVKEKKNINNFIHNSTSFMAHVDFVPNGSTGFQRPENITKINDKLDFSHKGSRKPTSNKIVNHKVDTRPMKISHSKKARPQTVESPTTRRTVIINNVAIELRSAQATNKTDNRTTLAVGRSLNLQTEITTTMRNSDDSGHDSRTDNNFIEESYTQLYNETDRRTVNELNDAILRNKTITNRDSDDFTNGTDQISNIESRSYFNNLSLTTKVDTTTQKLVKPTQDDDIILQLRQYPGDGLNSRPQTVIVDGPNTNQYEIEINIKQSSSSRKRPSIQYVDRNYNTNNRPYNYYDHSNQIVTSSTPFSYPAGSLGSSTQAPTFNNYFTQQIDYLQHTRTKPPTVIYLNDDGLLPTTSTRAPGFLQSIFGNRHKPAQTSSVSNSNTDKVAGHNTDTNVFSDSHDQPFNHNQNYYVNGHGQNRPSPYPSAISVSSHSSVGQIHASSTATSAGHFGSISGSASSNGGDSTFSFNYRPTPQADVNVQSTRRPTYGLVPARPQTQYSDSYFGQLDSYGNRRTSTQYTYSPLSSTSHPTYTHYTQSDNYHYNPFSSVPSRPSFNANNRSPPSETFSYAQRKTVSLSAELLGRSDQKLNDTSYYDYDMTTFESPKRTVEGSKEDYDYDDLYTNEPGKKFDRDGYLRPEHMVLDVKPREDALNTTSNKKVDDNYVFPMLNATLSDYKPQEDNTELSYPDSLPKRLSTDIFAEADFDYEIPRTIDAIEIAARSINKRPQLLSQVAFAPINVLTKPERPDNWILYESLEEKPLLPRLPELVSESTSATELPKPLANGFIGIKKPFYGRTRVTVPTTVKIDTTTTHTEVPDVTTTSTFDPPSTTITDNSDNTDNDDSFATTDNSIKEWFTSDANDAKETTTVDYSKDFTETEMTDLGNPGVKNKTN